MRVAMRMRVREGLEAEYRQVHRAVDQALLDACVEAGIRNYSIYISGRDLFSYLECDDLDKTMLVIANHPAEIAWQQKTGHLLEPIDGKAFEIIEEVFHTD